ncbi:MAG: hypothetical protein ACOC32_00425 [Nanoarchaeota archaeon]
MVSGKKKSSNSVAYFVARVGGWDGIALQAEHWLKLLLELKKKVTLVTGEVETEPGPLDMPPFSKVETRIIKDLSIAHQKELYNLSFKKRYNRDTWVDKFVKDKQEIKKRFRETVEKNDVIILHNFSIKHLIPSAWAAMYELMLEHKGKKFISIAADSPFERSYIVEKFSKEVLLILKEPKVWLKKSARKIKERLSNSDGYQYLALPGPDRAKNLKYIILNTNQKKVFHNIYGIPDEDLYAIPDMGGFEEGYVRRKPSKREFERFYKYLTRNQIANKQKELGSGDIYFISPVRSIRRKKLIEVAYACRLYQEFLHRKGKTNRVVLVVTHPNRDDKQYFAEVRRYAKRIGLTFVFLGEEIKLRKAAGDDTYAYEEVMTLFSYLNSICIVGSEFGGWENGILEASEHKIPVCVNPLLPSFQDMTALSYNYIAAPIMIFSDFAQIKLSNEYLAFPSIKTFYKKIYNRIFDKRSRTSNVNHNYSIGLKKQSKKVTKPQLRKLLRSFDM